MLKEMVIFRSKLEKEIAAIVFCIAISLIVTSRIIGPGLDTQNYIAAFKEIHQNGPSLESRYEPLSQIFVWLTSAISADQFSIFSVFIFFSIYLKSIAVRNIGGNRLIFFLLYLPLWAAILEANQIRAAMGLAFFFLSLSYLRESMFKAALLSAVAIGFHYSMAVLSVLLFVAIIIVGIRRNKLKVIALVSSLLLVSYLLIDFVIDTVVPRMLVMADTLEVSTINLLSAYAIVAYSMWALNVAGRIFSSDRQCPEHVPVILITSAGVAGFIYLARNEFPYAYRVLETTSSLLPYSLASLWRYSGNKYSRYVIGVIIICAWIVAPNYWVRNSQ